MRAGAGDGDGLALHDAQLVIARENGFRSWSKLKAHIHAASSRPSLMLAARVAAANRAVETTRRDALCIDPFARDLAGDEGRAVWEAMRQSAWPGYASGPDPYLTILTRFFDDALVAAVARAAISQVVLIGAATDTRAFRLEWPSDVRVFEVDGGDAFEHKEPVLHRLGAQPKCQRDTVITTSGGSFNRALRRRGFDPTRKAAFMIERLQFMQPNAVDRLLRNVTALASLGSWIGLSLVSNDTRQSSFLTTYLRRLEALGLPPWTFAVDDPDAWLATYGWNAHSVVAGAPDANYGRWIYGYVPLGTPAIPRGFFTTGWKS